MSPAVRSPPTAGGAPNEERPLQTNRFTDRSHLFCAVFLCSFSMQYVYGPIPPAALCAALADLEAYGIVRPVDRLGLRFWAAAAAHLPAPLNRRTPWPVDQEKNPASAQGLFSPVAYGARRRRYSTVGASGCRPCDCGENVSAVSCNGVRKRLCLSIQVHLLEPGSPQLPNILAGTRALG